MSFDFGWKSNLPGIHTSNSVYLPYICDFPCTEQVANVLLVCPTKTMLYHSSLPAKMVDQTINTALPFYSSQLKFYFIFLIQFAT